MSWRMRTWSLAVAALVVAGCGMAPPPVLLASSATRVLDSAKGDVSAENFRKVHDTLYRSGLPSDADMSEYKQLGIHTIVNLMNPKLPNESALVAHEKETAAKLGLKWVNIPLPFGIEPPKAMVAQYFDTVDNPAMQPALVHCVHGRDRTGTMIAAYRIKHDGYTNQQALDEMKTFGFNPKHYPFFASFIEHYKPTDSLLKVGGR